MADTATTGRARTTVFSTTEEKRAIKIVAALEDISESDLLRTWTIEQIVARFREFQPAA